jgi:hypothetical protein
VNDLSILAMNWKQSNKTFAEGNFDYSPDGLVNENDLAILSLNWQKESSGNVRSGAPIPAIPGITQPVKNPPVRRPPVREAQRVIEILGCADLTVVS